MGVSYCSVHLWDNMDLGTALRRCSWGGSRIGAGYRGARCRAGSPERLRPGVVAGCCCLPSPALTAGVEQRPAQSHLCSVGQQGDS